MCCFSSTYPDCLNDSTKQKRKERGKKDTREFNDSNSSVDSDFNSTCDVLHQLTEAKVHIEHFIAIEVLSNTV